ncbi:unnamed protein product [Arabidopsis thaliana]|uniref:(thale cress) hypothetical protein n=1 Tax=Arabidopsis thaliana TaxID=3702 RepID=A0A7G2EPI3_ARATH|nr:unnamed protein product [Arabidopsis thaliana]
MEVDPLIVGDLNADQSWAEWDDEVKDKKVAYMYDLIWASHQFQKNDWPRGDATLPPISVRKKKQSGVHKKHIVDCKKKLGVKSVAPKSKRRYSTRSKPELNLSDDEKSRLISELQTKVEVLSNRRKKTMEVPIQSQTPETSSQSHTLSEHVFGQPEVAEQVPDDHLDKAQDSSDSTPLINTEITDDPMDVFVTPLQSEHSNKDDANEGNPVYDTDVKDQNANEEDVDPSSNPSVEKLLPLNQNHISDGASERVPAIPSGLELSKEHNSEEQESNANEEDVDPRSDPSVEKLLSLNLDHIIDDASERVPATHSGLDLPKEHNSEELQTMPMKQMLMAKCREPASHSDIDLPIDQSSEEQQEKDTMEAAAASHSLLGFAKFAKKKVTLESAAVSQALSQTPLEVNFDGDPMKAMVIYSHPIYDTNSKPDKQSESSPTPMKDQITNSRDIGAHDLNENQEEGYVDVSDSSPGREREKPTLSEAEVFLVAELLSKLKTGSYELLPSISKSEFALFRNTLSAAPNTEHLTSSGFLISNKFLLSLAKPTNWVSTLHMEVLVSLLSQKLATTLTNQRATFVQPWYCKPECSQNHGLQPFYWKRLDCLYKNLRSGDCGPVAMKFLEIQASDNPPENMAKITDKHVDSFRRKYAMDIYEEFVCPLYASDFSNK